jgi:2-keto-4-pentenoate hydratase/2-oxohepta-3-ene-1,7-dioic acid hydratase in catechol pathway
VAVIGKQARNIPLEAVKDHIFGYTCGNDISALDVSDVDFNRTGRPHNFDGFSPFGPFIETDVDGDELTVRSAINGVTMVERSTRDMIYDVSTCIHTITQVFTLYPGDIVFLGSVKSFPFEIGDTLEVDIKDVGVLRNHVAAPR